MHIDTGHNFPEVIAFRDRRIAELGERLIVASVQDSIDRGRVGRGDAGPRASRNRLQTVTLLDAIAEFGFDAAFGGARRDEETARAPRSASSRSATSSASGTRRTSAPSCGTCTTAAFSKGEHVRVFPLSNWTEMDVWQYIASEELELPSIYFAHEREVFSRDGHAAARSRPFVPMRAERRAVRSTTVRFRTVGDMTCTGAVESSRRTLDEIIAESRGHAHHRARRDPRRRPVHRGGDGRPQAGRLLLDDRRDARDRSVRRAWTAALLDRRQSSTTARAR